MGRAKSPPKAKPCPFLTWDEAAGTFAHDGLMRTDFQDSGGKLFSLEVRVQELDPKGPTRVVYRIRLPDDQIVALRQGPDLHMILGVYDGDYRGPERLPVALAQRLASILACPLVEIAAAEVPRKVLAAEDWTYESVLQWLAQRDHLAYAPPLPQTGKEIPHGRIGNPG